MCLVYVLGLGAIYYLMNTNLLSNEYQCFYLGDLVYWGGLILVWLGWAILGYWCIVG